MNTRKFHLPGEAALLIVLLINPLAIDLMSKSVFGISTISSVPLILSTAFPVFSFGTWNYIFQTLLVITLMVLKRSFCPGYLFSFVVGIGLKNDRCTQYLGTLLPNVLSLNVVCFFTGFLLMCFGICLANNCLLPIVPTDIFPRDLSELLHKKYNQIKTTFDLTCLTTTVILSLVILHHLYGIGIGTVSSVFYDGTNRISGSKIHWKSCRILPSDEKRNGNAWEKDAPCIKKLPEFQFFC
ncbi:MAG: DUF6198 family protein [Fusicatenibacter saccharivorans]